MMTLQEFLEKQFDEELMLAVLSGQRSKEKDVPSRVRIRPIELKGSVWLFFAVSDTGKMRGWDGSGQQKRQADNQSQKASGAGNSQDPGA